MYKNYINYVDCKTMLADQIINESFDFQDKIEKTVHYSQRCNSSTNNSQDFNNQIV